MEFTFSHLLNNSNNVFDIFTSFEQFYYWILHFHIFWIILLLDFTFSHLLDFWTSSFFPSKFSSQKSHIWNFLKYLGERRFVLSHYKVQVLHSRLYNQGNRELLLKMKKNLWNTFLKTEWKYSWKAPPMAYKYRGRGLQIDYFYWTGYYRITPYVIKQLILKWPCYFLKSYFLKGYILMLYLIFLYVQYM